MLLTQQEIQHAKNITKPELTIVEQRIKAIENAKGNLTTKELNVMLKEKKIGMREASLQAFMRVHGLPYKYEDKSSRAKNQKRGKDIII